MKNTIIIAAVCLLTAGITFAVIAIGLHLKDSDDKIPDMTSVPDTTDMQDETASEVDMKGEQEMPDTKAGTGSIGNTLLPGYERLVFKAGLKEQNIKLFNPKENDCYFIITILLSDNREIYQSSPIAPGTSLDSIKLSYIPEPGTYEDVILRYSCFDTKTLEGLNGANIKFVLEVIE